MKMEKACSKCGTIKPLSEYYAHKGMLDGKRPDCKTCMMVQHREYMKRPEVRAAKYTYHKDYNANLTDAQRAKYAISMDRWTKKDPRHALTLSRFNALRRRPTDSPVSIQQLFDMWNRQAGKCALSGIVMTWRKGRILPTSISLDRIDNDRGYEADNVRLVCYAINAFRQAMTNEEVLAMAKALVAHMEQKSTAGLLSLVA